MTRTYGSGQPCLSTPSVPVAQEARHGTPEGPPLLKVSVLPSYLYAQAQQLTQHTPCHLHTLDSSHSIALWRLCLHLPLGNPEIPDQEGSDRGHPSFLPLKAGVTSKRTTYSNKRLSLRSLLRGTGLKGQGSVSGRRLGAASGLSPSHRKPARPQMKSEQRWQKVGLVSVTLRKLWPGAAGPIALPVRSGADPGRARPEMPSTGLPAGLPRRGEPLPGQVRAPDSAAASIYNPTTTAPAAR